VRMMQMMLVVQRQQDHEKHSVDDAHRHQKQGRSEGLERAAVGLIENALGLLGSAARESRPADYGLFAAESSKPRVELDRRPEPAL
jgi:hypothetical protein